MHLLPGAAETAHGLVEHFQVEEEGNQIGDGQCALQRQAAAEVDDHQQAQRGGEVDEGLEDGHELERAQIGALVMFDAIADAVDLFLFAGEGFDFADAGKVVVEHGVEVAEHALAFGESRADAAGINAQGENHQGDGHKAEQG